jgi:hypothetical protein
LWRAGETAAGCLAGTVSAAALFELGLEIGKQRPDRAWMSAGPVVRWWSTISAAAAIEGIGSDRAAPLAIADLFA